MSPQPSPPPLSLEIPPSSGARAQRARAMRRSRARAYALLLSLSWGIALAVLPSRTCSAHGGTPRPIALLFPDGAERPLLVDNLGFFQLRADAEGGGASGEEWRWLCDDAVDFETAIEGALLVEAERFLALSRRGLHRGDRGGCRWSFVEAEALAEHALEAASFSQTSAGLLLGTSTLGRRNELLYSEEGADWRPVLGPIEGPIYRVITAPNHPQRVYCNHAAGAAESRDGGLTWRPISVAPPGLELSPRELRLLAVSPLNPEQLFAARISFPSSQLLESRDGGQSWTSRWSVEDNIEELAISESGEVRLTTSFSGLWGFTLGDEAAPSLISPDAVGCLRFGPEGQLWSCGRARPPQWLIARSGDLGGSWEVQLADYPQAPAPWCTLNEPSTISCVGQCTPNAPPVECAEPDQGPPPGAGHGRPDFGSERTPESGEGCHAHPRSPLLTGFTLFAALLFCWGRRREEREREAPRGGT